MSVIGELAVQLTMDSAPLDKGIKGSKSKLDGFAKSMGSIGRAMTLGVTTPIAAGFVKILGAASDLNEGLSSVGTVYGSASDTIINASKDAATAVGLSQSEYLSAATVLGTYATQAGLTGEAMATFSTEMIGASADLASFYNAAGGSQEVLDAIKSGLMGESEPLRKFGIILTENSVAAKAMEMGLAGANGEISEQAKVQARAALIQEQMGAATGDFAKTSDGLANSSRILKAQLADVAAEMGQVLLPYALQMAKGAQKLIKHFQGLSNRNKRMVVILAAVAAAIGPVLIAISAMIPAVTALAVAFSALTWPIALVVLALVGLGIAYKTNFLGFADAVNWTAAAVWKAIQPIIKFVSLMAEAFRSGKSVKELLEGIPGPLQGVAKQFLIVADSIGDLVAAFQSGGLKGLLRQIPEELKTIAKAFLNFQKEIYKLMFEGLKAGAKLLILGLRKGLDAAWPSVKKWIASIPGWAKTALGSLSETLKAHGEKLIQGLRQGAAGYWDNTLKPFIQGLPNKAFHAFDDLMAPVEALKDHGIALIKGLLKGIDEKWKEVKNFITGIPGAVKSLAKTLTDTVTDDALHSLGAKIIAGFMGGLQAKWNATEAGVKGFILGIPAGIAAFARQIVGASGALVSVGYDIATGLITGIDNRWNSVLNFARGLANAAWETLMAPFHKFNEFMPGPDIPIPGSPFAQSAPPQQQTTGRMVSGMSAASSGNNLTWTGDIIVQGYNKNPDELTHTIATTLSRELRLAGGFS